MPYPQFHFLMLAAGEVLKKQATVNAKNIQDAIYEDDAFGVKVPVEDCSLALKLMTDSGLLIRWTHDEYIKDDEREWHEN